MNGCVECQVNRLISIMEGRDYEGQRLRYIPQDIVNIDEHKSKPAVCI